MKRVFRIIVIVVVALIAVVYATFLIGIKSNAVHQIVIARLNAAIPGTLTLGKLRLSLLDMRLELRDFTLADSSGKKLTGFSRLLVDISPLALIRRVLIVEEVVLENPQAKLEIDSRGQLSLLSAFLRGEPKPKDTTSTKPDSTSQPFQIKLQSLDITGGTIFFATERDSLNVQAHGIAITANGETGTFSGDVSLTFDSMTIVKNGEFLHLYSLALMTRINDMDIDTITFKVQTDSSFFTLNGNASSLTKDPVANITLAADCALSEFGGVVGIKEALSGTANLRMHLEGTISNPDLDLEIVYGGGTIYGYIIDTLSLTTQMTDRILELNPLHVQAAMGRVAVTGSVDARTIFTNGFLKPPGTMQELKYNLALSGEEIPLKKLVPAMSGIAAVSVSVDGQGVHPDSLEAILLLTSHVTALQLDTANTSQDMSLTCSASVLQGIAQVDVLELTLGSTALSLAGSYGITTGDMKAKLALAVPKLGELLDFTGTDSVSGSAHVSIDIGGDLKNPQAVIDLKTDSLTFDSFRIGNITLAGELDKDGTAWVKKLSLINKSSELQLSASANVLNSGVPVAVDSMVFDCILSIPNLFIEDFIDSIGGTVILNTAIKGTISDPHGHMQFTGTDISAAGQHIPQINLDATFDQQRVFVEPLRITIEPGQYLAINGWASLKDSFDVAISTKGIYLQSLDVLAAVDSLEGVVTMDFQAGGTYTNPEVHGNLGVDNIHIGTLSPDAISLQIDMSNQQVALKGKAVGDLDASYNIDTKAFSTDLAVNNLFLKPYLALSGLNLDGFLTSTINLSGNSDSLSNIRGSVAIKKLNILYDSTQIIETNDLYLSLEKNSYSVPDFNIILAKEGVLTGYAKGLLEGPHDIAISGNIPLIIVRHFSPDYPDIEGSISIDAALQGTVSNPNLSADIRLNDIGMSVPGLTGRLHSLNGKILANRESVRIETLQGNIDEGTLTIQGEIKLDSLKPSGLSADIAFKALPVSVPDMLDLVLDSKLHIEGTPDTTQITGVLSLLGGLYYQDIVINPLAGVGKRKRKESASQAEITIPYLKNLRLDVGVQAREPFRVDNNMAQLSISPDLQLMGSLATPSLNGRAKVEQGTITYQKKIFTVDKGVIDFVNPYAIEPQIDIVGSVPVREWTITVALSGPPDDLVFKLSSDDPNLQDQDLISLLVLGKTMSELQGGIKSGGGQSNQQMLASLVASTFGEDIRKATGLDILQVETGDSQSEKSDRIAVTVGKQLTKRLATKYTVESDNGVVVQRATAEYRILQNLYLAGYQDTKSIFGSELRLTWEKR